MSSFRYEARNRQGTPCHGTLEAASSREAARFLRERGLWVTGLREHSPPRFSWRALLRRRKPQYALLFLRQLGMMLEELPLGEALSLLAKQPGEAGYRAMLRDMSGAVSLGRPLAAAMERHGHVFSPQAIALMAAGEQSGSLPEAARQLACHLEREIAHRQKFRSAMLYPAFLGIAAMLAIFVMLAFILPSFLPLFASLHVELPWPTRMFLWLGDFLAAYGAVLLAGGALLAAVSFRICREGRIREAVDAWRLRLPLFGTLARQREWARLLGTLAILVRGGIRLDLALGMLPQGTGNRCLQAFLRQARREVERGYSLASAFRVAPFFPEMLLGLISAGESSGRLEAMLQKGADDCAMAAEASAERLQAMVEPCLILVLGGIVFLFVLSIVLPLMDSMDAIY